jgi:NAD(P)-dependent dehydrogenase (short-subunit alcohol dehydrogenase family)
MTSAILVTGASTGIGYSTAELLARHGFTVFAGVRKDADAIKLGGAHEDIRPIRLDVEDAQEIAAAAQIIADSEIPLAGVVNNAGIAVPGPLEYLPIDDLRRQFEINVFGAIAVTQAMLPLLRRSKGRVVFMSSVSGTIVPPYLGAYAGSKFALEAMADALRMELSAFGIRVSLIQPGAVRTPIWQKGRESKAQIVASMPAAATEHYAGALDSLVSVTQREERSGIEPEIVAQYVLRALTAPHPRARYAVGNPAGWQRRMAALLPERWRDRLIMRTVRGESTE